jgi:hypothetical protein
MFQRAVMASAVALLVAPSLFGHDNPSGEAQVSFDEKTVRIEYGRPSLKGRDMLAQAQVGVTWRMGADKATTLSTQTDLRFGSISVPAGSYVLKAKKVGEGAWQLLVTDSDDVTAGIPLVAKELAENVELLTIGLVAEGSQGQFEMRWGTTSLTTKFVAD